MKKLLFFAVSAILAGASYCSSVSEKIVAKVTNSDTQIEQQQEQSLVLEQSSAEFKLLYSPATVLTAATARIVHTVLIALIVHTIRADKKLTINGRVN